MHSARWERAAGRPATSASDLYSLGVVGYECLTGAPPFRGSALEVAESHVTTPFPALPATVPAGRYQLCLADADARAVAKQTQADYARCDKQLRAKWHKTEQRAGGTCPTTSDLARVRLAATRHGAAIATPGALMSGLISPSHCDGPSPLNSATTSSKSVAPTANASA